MIKEISNQTDYTPYSVNYVSSPQCKGNKYIRVIIMDLRRKIISLHIYKRSVTSAEKAFVNQCLEHDGGQKIRLEFRLQTARHAWHSI